MELSALIELIFLLLLAAKSQTHVHLKLTFQIAASDSEAPNGSLYKIIL